MFFLNSLFQKVNDAIAKLEAFIISFFMALLVLIMVVQVALRYFFNSPLFWAEEISLQLLVLITFFGVSFLTYKKNLLLVDLLQHYLSVSMKRLVNILLVVVNLVIFVFLAYLFINWSTDPMVQADVSGTTGLPRWYNYAVATAAVCFMAYHQFCHLLHILFNKAEEEVTVTGGLL